MGLTSPVRLYKPASPQWRSYTAAVSSQAAAPADSPSSDYTFQRGTESMYAGFGTWDEASPRKEERGGEERTVYRKLILYAICTSHYHW